MDALEKIPLMTRFLSDWREKLQNVWENDGKLFFIRLIKEYLTANDTSLSCLRNFFKNFTFTQKKSMHVRPP